VADVPPAAVVVPGALVSAPGVDTLVPTLWSLPLSFLLQAPAMSAKLTNADPSSTTGRRRRCAVCPVRCVVPMDSPFGWFRALCPLPVDRIPDIEAL
jgi:hypothetical protein